jgi:hypothetical protein
MPVPAGGPTGYTTIPPTGAYASRQDLADAGIEAPANVDRLLLLASRIIRRATLTTPPR